MRAVQRAEVRSTQLRAVQRGRVHLVAREQAEQERQRALVVRLAEPRPEQQAAREPAAQQERQRMLVVRPAEPRPERPVAREPAAQRERQRMLVVQLAQAREAQPEERIRARPVATLARALVVQAKAVRPVEHTPLPLEAEVREARRRSAPTEARSTLTPAASELVLRQKAARERTSVTTVTSALSTLAAA